MRDGEGHKVGVKEDKRRIARISSFSSKEAFPVINNILFDEFLGRNLCERRLKLMERLRKTVLQTKLLNMMKP